MPRGQDSVDSSVRTTLHFSIMDSGSEMVKKSNLLIVACRSIKMAATSTQNVCLCSF